MSAINDNDKLMALLAYLLSPIAPVIMLLVETMKARPYQKYHALQSLGLFVVSMIYSVVACICYFIAATLSAGILGLCLWIIFFLPFIPFVYYAIIAYARPAYFEIPVVTKFMMQQGWLTK